MPDQYDKTKGNGGTQSDEQPAAQPTNPLPPGAQSMGATPDVPLTEELTKQMEEIKARMATMEGAPAPANAAQAAQMMLSSIVYQTMAFMVRGMIFSLCQPDPRAVMQFHPQAVMITCCRMMAQLVGESFQGPLSDILSARRMCREAFLDTLTKMPVPPPPQEAPGSGMPSGPGPRLS